MSMMLLGSYNLHTLGAASAADISIHGYRVPPTLCKIDADAGLLAKLVKFHEPTYSCDSSPQPDMRCFEKQNRYFVAKIDSFGFDRYFSFKTNADVNELVKSVQSGAGMDVSWYYYEKAPKAATTIDIAGLDKAAILVALYAIAKPRGHGIEAFVAGDLPYDEAKEILTAQKYVVDYLYGRALKIRFDTDILLTESFNEIYGPNAAEGVIENLRRVSHL